MTIKEIMQKKESRIYACEKSLELFSIYYFTEYHTYRMPEFHKEWYKAFNEKDIMSIVTFRESAKSSLSKIKIIHDIVYNKKKFILWVSFDKSKAKSNLFDIAVNLQTNKKIIADFGQLFYGKSDEKKSEKKSIDEFITTNDIKLKALSTGQTPRGEVYKEHRPNLICLDDIENLDTIDSEAKTEQVKHFMDELLGGLSGNAQIILLGNRLTFNGSITYFEDKIKHISNVGMWDIPVVKDGEITWKDKYCFTDEEAKKTGKVSLENKKKLLGHQAYNREMLNIPITDEEKEFRKEWIQEIEDEKVKMKRTRNFLTVDTAMSEKKEADFTGIVENFVDDDNYWNIKAYGLKLNAKALVDFLFTSYQNNNWEQIGIEKTQYLWGLKAYIEEECRKRGVYLPIVELSHNQTQKETRIRGLIPRYSNKSINHIKGQCKDLEEQLDTFPRCINDDVLDALAYQNQIAEKPNRFEDINLDSENLYDDIGI